MQKTITYLARMTLLILMPLSLGQDGCPGGGGTKCGDTVEGLLPAGAWGGEHWLWEVADDGITYLETDCGHGTSSEPVLLDNRTVTFQVAMVGEGGPVQDPPEEEDSSLVLVEGRLCNDTLTFTMTYEDGAMSEGAVVLGASAELLKCY